MHRSASEEGAIKNHIQNNYRASRWSPPIVNLIVIIAAGMVSATLMPPSHPPAWHAVDRLTNGSSNDCACAGILGWLALRRGWSFKYTSDIVIFPPRRWFGYCAEGQQSAGGPVGKALANMLQNDWPALLTSRIYYFTGAACIAGSANRSNPDNRRGYSVWVMDLTGSGRYWWRWQPALVGLKGRHINDSGSDCDLKYLGLSAADGLENLTVLTTIFVLPTSTWCVWPVIYQSR